MPYIEAEDVRIHYIESGEGDPIIMIHGLSENTAYWGNTGVIDALSQQYRVIAVDMRAHGKTECHNNDFTTEALIADIGTVADALNLDRFHLIGHSTGGMISVRYAMDSSSRLLSLVLNGCGSKTDYFAQDQDREASREFYDKFAQAFENFTWKQMVAFSKKNPFPFFLGIVKVEDNEKMWSQVEEVFELNDNKLVASFIRTFYTDPDPMVTGLRKIACPTLIIHGEHDAIMAAPSKLMAAEIPGSKHVIMDGIGHMTAIEDPEGTISHFLSFLNSSREAVQ